MEHQVLFRKYRPQTFGDVVYQDLTVTALQNAFKSKRIGHSYIFFGPRGVGKTSIARILAKRLNCEKPVNNEPCNVCTSCTEITNGNSPDVLEMDAASNRSIDDVRALRESVKFHPTHGKYKIYIIDEVHMLTNDAFNGLLKTLEEPPSYVVFILATTEHHKVPETILSRCQEFYFKKIPISVLQEYVELLCKKEGLEYDSEGLFWIAKRGDGSLRDTLSFMEQAVVYTNGKLVGKEIRSMIGYVGITEYSEFLEGLFSKNPIETTIQKIETYFREGEDFLEFLWNFLEFLNSIQLIQIGASDKENVNLPPEDILVVKERFQSLPKEKLNHISEKIYMIYEKLNLMKLRNSFEMKVFLEIQMRMLIEDLSKPTVSGLILKIEELSKLVQKEAAKLGNLPEGTAKMSSSQPQKSTPVEAPKPVLPSQQSASSPSQAPSKPLSSSQHDSDKQNPLQTSLEDSLKEGFLGSEVNPKQVPEF